jgi:hypothetical protein
MGLSSVRCIPPSIALIVNHPSQAPVPARDHIPSTSGHNLRQIQKLHFPYVKLCIPLCVIPDSLQDPDFSIINLASNTANLDISRLDLQTTLVLKCHNSHDRITYHLDPILTFPPNLATSQRLRFLSLFPGRNRHDVSLHKLPHVPLGSLFSLLSLIGFRPKIIIILRIFPWFSRQRHDR